MKFSVRAAIELSLRNYFNTVGETIEPQSPGPEHMAEFARLRERLRLMEYDTVDSIMGVFGDPAFCIDKIAELKQRFGFTRLVNWFEVGGLSGHQQVIDSMRLFAESVQPRFQ